MAQAQIAAFRLYLLRFNRNLFSMRYVTNRLGERGRNFDKRIRTVNKSVNAIQQRSESL